MSRFDTLLASGMARLQTFGGETVVYQSAAGGSPRTITATVSRHAEIVQANYGTEEREFADVTVSRDSDGIDAPAVGDKITLPEDDRPYGWTGRKPVASSGFWNLEFSRPKLLRQGAAQTMEQP